MDIITDFDKLSVRCDEIDPIKEGKEVQNIVVELKKKIRETGVTALSANQLGYDKRVMVIKFKSSIKSFVNPIIQRANGITLAREKCVSIPGKTFIRPRNTDITVAYQTPTGKIETSRLVGLSAIMFQHHVDHLDGILISDVGLEIDEDFDKATEEERNEIINMYLDSMDMRSQQMQKEIEDDEELSKISKAVEFIQKVGTGEVTIETEKKKLVTKADETNFNE